MWNPPITDEALATRRSPLAEAADLLAELVIEGARTIVFMKSRKAVELMARFAAARARGPRAARAGRADRALPRGLHAAAAARARAAAAWRASCSASSPPTRSSSGIDIGSLDAAICVTFPGTVASLRQMWGRAGRRGRGLAVYVAGEDALDQFFCRHPDEFLDRPVEAAILDHENEQIHAAHVLCAAHEGPLEPADARALGPRWRGHSPSALEARRRAAPAARRHLRPARGRTEYPAGRGRRCARRAATASRSSTSAPASCSATVDVARAPTTVHEGAIYLHGGRAFEVAELDLDAPARARAAVRRRLVHAAQARDRHARSSACSTAARRSA